MSWPRNPAKRHWPEYLLAILLGNIIYLLLSPRLPGPLQHRAFQIDLGLAVDFALCLLVYGAVVWVRRS
jgi:hypothetical protein